MSVHERTGSADRAARPEIELQYRYDDARSPNELTVFVPGSESLATEWLTVNEEAALALDGMR